MLSYRSIDNAESINLSPGVKGRFLVIRPPRRVVVEALRWLYRGARRCPLRALHDAPARERDTGTPPNARRQAFLGGVMRYEDI
jgi:hypothetical protein